MGCDAHAWRPRTRRPSPCGLQRAPKARGRSSAAQGATTTISLLHRDRLRKICANFAQHCFAPTGGRRFGCCLTPPCPCPHTAPARLARASPVPPPAWQVLHETPSVLRADDEGQNHLNIRRRVWAEGRPLLHTSRGAEPPEHHGAAPTEERSARSTRCTSSSVPAAAARRRHADLRPAGAG